MENIDVTTESSETVNEIVSERATRASREVIIAEAMDRLLGAADLDSEDRTEYDLLGKLMTRVGYMWTCINPACNCVNHLADRTCINCRGRRYKKRDVPKPDSMA